mmetsp:Transcript_1710/g.3762  ORF Transcript_1710/g.3762 Transcript_1710/m.3762 type:complete len:500 (-) Transcript_1710:212-1711(-)
MSAIAAPLCRCFCGSSRQDEFDPTRVVVDAFTDEEAPPPPPCPPPLDGYLSYSASTDQPLRGVPIREGNLWLLSAEEEVAMVALSLYINGFSFSHKGREHTFSLSPFSLVRNCKFQATTSEGVDLSDFKCFKISLFTHGACFYFGIRATSKGSEQEVEEERSRWVVDISRAMRLVTQSLFPPFSIVCEPLPGLAITHKRLMAGYLLHHDDIAVVSVLYCELHPQSRDHARLVIYENEMCQAVLMEIFVTERSTCCEKVGISCSCFSIEDHLFSTRSLAERKLWLRAISNVKVKLQNRAPGPTAEELGSYRQAIREHIRASKAMWQAPTYMDALLQRHCKKAATNSTPSLVAGSKEVESYGGSNDYSHSHVHMLQTSKATATATTVAAGDEDRGSDRKVDALPQERTATAGTGPGAVPGSDTATSTASAASAAAMLAANAEWQPGEDQKMQRHCSNNDVAEGHGQGQNQGEGCPDLHGALGEQGGDCQWQSSIPSDASAV